MPSLAEQPSEQRRWARGRAWRFPRGSGDRGCALGFLVHPDCKGKQSCCVDPDALCTHGLVLPFLRRVPWPAAPPEEQGTMWASGWITSPALLSCLHLTQAGTALCGFSGCTVPQLRASKTQPLSEAEGSQRSLILQSQAGEGFRLPWVIWLWQLAAVATLLGEGERLWGPSKEVQLGGRSIFH